MITVDTETCGLVGPCVTIQWAEDDGAPVIHEVWKRPTLETILLIERMAATDICGFNLAFDWFHLQRLHNIIILLPAKSPPTVKGWLDVEKRARFGPCVKPRAAIDVMLHAKRGKWQSLMARDNIHIRRVPIALAPMLAEHLTANTHLDPIYFSRREGGMQWGVNKHSLEEDPEFPDVELVFGASGGLKPLARHLLGVEANDFPVPVAKRPTERLWDIFGRDWVRVLPFHIAFWHAQPLAREYAMNDVTLTRDLWKHFGSPPPGDDDSELACQVGSARWRGYAVDLEALDRVATQAEERIAAAPGAPKTVLYELHQRMSEIERLAVTDTRTEPTLHNISAEFGDAPAGEFARKVIARRSAEKERDVCHKIKAVERAHFSFKVIAALSGRMGGDDDLNPQGIPGAGKGSTMRSTFTLADGCLPVLDAGDFESFEPSIMAGVYGDVNLANDIQTGLKLHAVFGSMMYRIEYDEVRSDPRLYLQSKRARLGRFYGAEAAKLSMVLGLELDDVEEGLRKDADRYPQMAKAVAATYDAFQWMHQHEERGRISWRGGVNTATSALGYVRSFELEQTICKSLFELAGNLPADFKKIVTKLSRKAGRMQTPGGATTTAIYAAAFNIQASAQRARRNHEIQATGAEVTKRLQRRIWDHQPSGVHPWLVQPLNVHDEVQCPRARHVSLRETAREVVETYRDLIPLIKMEWMTGLPNWGAKA